MSENRIPSALVLGVIALAVAAHGIVDIVIPAESAIRSLALRSARRVRPERPLLAASRARSYGAVMRRLEQTVHAAPQITTIISESDRVARENGVSVTGIVPGPAAAGGGFTLTVTGRFGDVLRFMHGLASASFIARVDGLRIARTDRAAGTASDVTASLDISVITDSAET